MVIIAILLAALTSAPVLPWSTFSSMTDSTTSVVMRSCEASPQEIVVMVAVFLSKTDGHEYILVAHSARWVLYRRDAEGRMEWAWAGQTLKDRSDAIVPELSMPREETLKRFSSPCDYLALPTL